MFMEFMIFMAFYAVAFLAHSAHAVVAKKGVAVTVASTHRFALYFSVLAKALAPALHEYAVHFIVYSGYVLKSH
jgi:hypothetical protein